MRTITHFVPRTPIPRETIHTLFVTRDDDGVHYLGASDRRMDEHRFQTLVDAGVLNPVARWPIECSSDSYVAIGPKGTVMLKEYGRRMYSRIGRVDREPTDRKITLTHATNRGNPGGTFDVRVADVNHVTWHQDGHTEVAFRSPLAGDGFEEVSCVMEHSMDVIAAIEGR